MYSVDRTAVCIVDKLLVVVKTTVLNPRSVMKLRLGYRLWERGLVSHINAGKRALIYSSHGDGQDVLQLKTTNAQQEQLDDTQIRLSFLAVRLKSALISR